MTLARDALARVPLASADIGSTTPPGQVIPPPIPGGTTTYTYGAYTGLYPLGMRSLAGGIAPTVWTGGGIIVAPQPALGLTRVTAWWPDAPQLQIVRLTDDGARVPVRGAYPLATTQQTRRNYATNPSVETGLNGYVPGTGNPTLTQIARTDEPNAGSLAWRATNAAAGTSEITIPHSVPVQQRITVALDLRYSALPTGVTISMGWTDAAGSALTTSSVALTASQVSSSVGQWQRQVVTLVAPTGAVHSGSLKVTATGMPAGGQLDGDRVLVELGDRSNNGGIYFDGAVLGATWAGTAHLSVSILAPLLTVDDGECPLDVPVRYELFNPRITGGRMTSPPTLLESTGRTWLTHPASPATPITIDLRSVPSREHTIEQGVFHVIGRRRAIVVTGAERHAPSGTIQINAISAAERDSLLTLFRDGSPVLVRTPSAFHLGTAGTWYSLGALTEDREGRKAWHDAWLLSAPYYEVDPPDPSVAA